MASRQQQKARAQALRAARVPRFATPGAIHTEVAQGKWHTKFRAGIAYRPQPTDDPLLWDEASPLWTPGLGGRWENNAVQVKTVLPVRANGSFEIWNEVMGRATIRYPEADNQSVGVQTAPDKIMYPDVFPGVDLILTARPLGVKVAWVFKDDRTQHIEVQFSSPYNDWFVQTDGVMYTERRGVGIEAGRFAFGVPYYLRDDHEQVYMNVEPDTAAKKTRWTLPDAMAGVAYPFTFDPTYQGYPDADPETSTTDGYVRRQTVAAGQSLANIRAGSGTDAFPSGANISAGMRCGTDTDKLQEIRRGIMLFDTSALPTVAVFSAGDLTVQTTSQITVIGDNASVEGFYDLVEPDPPDTDTGLLASDYVTSAHWTNLPQTPFGSIGDTAITGAGGEDVVTITTFGFVDPDGISYLGVVNDWDNDAAMPTGWWGSSNWQRWLFDSADGATAAPELNLTYTAEVAKVVSEAVNMVEAAHDLGILNQILDEALNIIETVVRISGVAKVVDEVLNIVESTVQRLVKYSVVDEALNMVESSSTLRTFAQVVTEALNMVEAAVPGLFAIVYRVLHVTMLPLVRTLIAPIHNRRIVNVTIHDERE